MKGQANTIKGIGIQLETAFRGVGDAILGVDADTAKFVKGGLGDTLVKGLGRATEVLKTFATMIRENLPKVRDIISSVATAFKIAALQVAQHLAPKLQALGDTVTTKLIPALTKFWKNVLAPLAPVIGTILVGAIGLAIDYLNLWYKLLAPVINFMANNKGVVYAFAGAFIALRAAMAISAAVASFKAGTTAIQLAIANTKLKLVAFRLLAASPVSMGVIAVAAALASIAMVYKAVKSVMGAIEAMNNAHSASDAATKSQDSTLKLLKTGSRMVHLGNKRMPGRLLEVITTIYIRAVQSMLTNPT